MNPFSLTNVIRVSIIRAVMLQESGITITIGTQATNKSSSNPGQNLTSALIGLPVQETIAQKSGTSWPSSGAKEWGGGVGAMTGRIAGEAGGASEGTGTGGGAGTGGQGGVGGGTSCFPIGTMIGILGGEVPIEKVIGGMHLEDSGMVLSRVDHAPRDWELLTLVFDDGELQITPEHMIFCRRILCFLPAELLRVGDELRMKDRWTTVRKITRVIYNGFVYNLLTSNGTFLANHVLVHNMKC